MKERSKTPLYAAIQALYWMNACLMFNYASLYLLDSGYNNSQIGVILGLIYALSAAMQVVFGMVLNRCKISISTAIAGIFAFNALMALTVALHRGEGLALGIRIIIMFTLQSSLLPTINSIHHCYELRGVKVNYALARGLGSAAFSVTALLMGQVLRFIQPVLLPYFYVATNTAMTVCLLLFRSPEMNVSSAEERGGNRLSLLKNRRFVLFMCGVTGLVLTHIFTENFMLQRMQEMGGGAAELGITMAISSSTELPAMAMYGYLCRKLKIGFTLTAAGWIWAIRTLLFFFARTPQMMYLIAPLQFFAYAIYVPAAVDFIAKLLPPEDFLKGQALVGAAFTSGSLIAMLFGGRLLDAFGVHTAMGMLQVFSIAGAVLLTLSVPDWKKKKA